MQNHLEIERKFLIKMPDVSFLRTASEEIWKIEQIYLQASDDRILIRRVSPVIFGENKPDLYKEKKRISDVCK